MDLKWIIPKEIKQEEPVEYYLISSTSDRAFNVAFDKYSNEENLAVKTFD